LSSLEKLRAAENLSGLAKLLGYTPSGLAYVLYKIHPSHKYRSFEIGKRHGGARDINAPTEKLALVQQRLSELLYQCVNDIKSKDLRYWKYSHGFDREKTIVSNASAHRRKRYVFNLDLADFFGAINFGRVRGFFLKDRYFELASPVATVIAQIACYENRLPQGSPTSPVISNLVGNILDSRIVPLARRASCAYTRYADDLTFSTNEKTFPVEIAEQDGSCAWVPSAQLKTVIERSGFAINPTKTRMCFRTSCQTVTGLTVNKKPNVNQEFYRSARSMCNSLFNTRKYHRPLRRPDEAKRLTKNLAPLEGILSHIHFVRSRKDRSFQSNKKANFSPPHAPIELYRKFLFFKHFVANNAPIIVPEGETDAPYLRIALRQLATHHKSLLVDQNGGVAPVLRFLRTTGTARGVLNLGAGSAGQNNFIQQYENRVKKYGHRPLLHPVIVLCDNDDGSKEIFKSIEDKAGVSVSLETTEPFYYICENLYVVKIPEGTPPKKREIEDLFPQEWLEAKIDRKPFDRKKKHGDENAYGKTVFLSKVVMANAANIDFSGFSPLFKRIEGCLEDYLKRLASKTHAA